MHQIFLQCKLTHTRACVCVMCKSFLWGGGGTPAPTGAKAASLLMFRDHVQTHLTWNPLDEKSAHRKDSSQHTTFSCLTTYNTPISQRTTLLSHNTQHSPVSQHTTFSCLTTHNIPERHTSMRTAGFEPATPASERSQTYATG